MTEYVGAHDNGKSSVEGLEHVWGNLFTPGVSSIDSSTSWKVTQRGAGTNMSVDIQIGAGLISPGSFVHPCWSTAIVNVAVVTADPSNPRHDIVVAYVDNSAANTASNNNPGALKFKVVQGVAASSPNDPTSGDIQTDVGVGNPWIYLGRLTIPANHTPIVNGDITDLRQQIAFRGKLIGGSSNTVGHIVPNIADDTVALLAAAQALSNKDLGTQSAYYDPDQTLTSTSVVDFPTNTPSVTAVVPSHGKVRYTITGTLYNTSAAQFTNVYLTASGANTIAANSRNLLSHKAAAANSDLRNSVTGIISGLTPGSTVFKLQGAVSGGTGHFVVLEIDIETNV